MRRPIPPDLHRTAIRTSSADDHGLTRRRLRGRDVQHPFREVSAFDLDLATVHGLCTAFLPVMEHGQVFTHTTALALHGVPLPALVPELHVSVPFPRTPPRRPNVVGHSLKDAPAILLDGMSVSPPLIAWAQSGTLLSHADLVAAGDRLALPGRPGTLAAPLTAFAEMAVAWSGRPGATALAWAASRVRVGVRSRPETHLRLLLVRAGLPEPVVEFPVTVSGGIVLHPDLSYPERRLAIEYEGGHHRDATIWETDIERRELLAEATWRTLRVTRTQLYAAPGSVVARVRSHLHT